jgi:hypothetical protein
LNSALSQPPSPLKIACKFTANIYRELKCGNTNHDPSNYLFRETHSDQHSINEIPSNRVICLHKICIHSTTSRPSFLWYPLINSSSIICFERLHKEKRPLSSFFTDFFLDILNSSLLDMVLLVIYMNGW